MYMIKHQRQAMYTMAIWQLLVSLLAVAFTQVQSGASLLIKPTEGVPPRCQGDGISCQTLSHYLSTNLSVFNTSDSLFEFLPGIHSVQVDNIHQVIIQDVNNITWYGNSAYDTIIQCETSMAFIFADIRKLTISDLQISNCGYQLPSILSAHVKYSKKTGPRSYNTTSAALALANVNTVHLERVVIQQSRGYGLLGINFWRECKIISCSFKENNKNCANNKTEPEHSTRDCVGGNAILAFYDHMPSRTHDIFTPKLSIVNSMFFDGVDGSEGAFNCSEFKQTVFANSRRANGLVVVAGQKTYRVSFHLDRSQFTRNNGNIIHPAVLVYDYSGVTNSFFITNCFFDREGTLLISVLDEDETSGGKIRYRNDKTNNGKTKNIVVIENSTFTRGSNTGLKVCVRPIQLRYYRYQLISVRNCSFENYQQIYPRISESAIKVDYNYSDTKSNNRCPSVRIEVHNTSFTFNRIPSLTCLLGEDTYLEGNDKDGARGNCSIIILRGLTFSNNYTPENSTVTIEAPRNKFIEMWKYEYALNIHGNDITRVYISNTTFTNNTCEMSQGVLWVKRIYFVLDSCDLSLSSGTALHALQSVVQLKGNNKFLGNEGVMGGGLNLNKSRIFLLPNSKTLIAGNHGDYGGGLFSIPELSPKSTKFPSNKNRTLSYNRCTLSSPYVNPTVTFKNNTADYAGDSIFGGTYNKCRFIYQCKRSKCSYKPEIFPQDIPPYIETPQAPNLTYNSEISSTPTRLCTCNSNCTSDQECDKVTLSRFSGQTFNVSLVALGELNGTTAAVVTGTICKDYSKEEKGACKHDFKHDIGYGQRMQTLTRYCTNVTFTVNSLEQKEFIEVKIDKKETPLIKFSKTRVRRLMLEVNLLPCPVGFSVFNKTGKPPGCKCLEYLSKHNIQCDINSGKISRPQNKWIFSKGPNETVVHNNCPFDYCLPHSLYVDLSTPDKQCNFNRGGVICGACRTNLSLVLGTSNCKECSNTYILLILPFALAGLALVVFLLKCNLTVSTGHINAIIFYANIVQVNKALLFTEQGTAQTFFSIFIAWLNLDLGIETCFFENMDMYSRVWLQFVFPVYLWFLVGLIILFANYSSRSGKIVGNNSVPVLATLFLLSYAKLLQTIIASVSFSYIEYENGTYSTVWLLDGNIPYFSLKHVALFVTALVFAVGYILPLTILVLFSTCIQARSHYRALHWVNRLKPFLDAYQGPYNDKFRYWTGLMLIVRIVLFTLFAGNYLRDPPTNFLLIVVVAGTLGVFIMTKKHTAVYRDVFSNIIEVICLLNMAILFLLNSVLTTTAYRKWHSMRIYITYSSIATTILLFLVILLYRAVIKFCPNIFSKTKKFENHKDDQSIDGEMTMSAPTSSVVDLSDRDSLVEPLLESVSL